MTLTSPIPLGEFVIHAVLGQGGSGIVYDATWGPRRVALKVLHAERLGAEGGTAGERVRAQFLGEAKRLQAISHPSVVKVLAVGELPDRRPYLAMERLEGETLASVLARGPIALPEALVLFGELCAAVAALHEQGLIHRDLKPENVFVVSDAATGRRHVVLLDFGIAKELWAPASTTTQDGGVRGTPAYMAPERFFGQPAGVPTDVYELAVTLYAMLAGRLPWDDVADPEARLSPRPLDHVPHELDVEVRRAMSTRAQNRPESVTALREAVQRAAGAPDASVAPSETAKLAPAAPPPDAAPWFAGRQPTTDRGQTPLAWAPTEAQPPQPPAPPRRRRWPFVVGGRAIAGIAGAIIAAQVGGDPAGAADAAVAVAPSDAAGPSDTPSDAAVGLAEAPRDAFDPWASREAPEVPEIELSRTGPELSVAEARAQLAAAIVHVPADTHLLFTVSLDELRAHEQWDEVLGKIKRQPLVGGLVASTPPCVGAVISGAQWAVYASPSLDDANRATMILRGRWTRADIEKCFAEDSVPLTMPDGKRMLQLRRVGWIDFLDEHTIYLSVREDLAAAQVHGLVARGTGPAASTQRLLAKLPADRTLGVVIDGSPGLEWPKDYLPKGSTATAWLRAATYSELAVIADARSAAAAQKLVAAIKPQVDEVFASKQSAFLGTLTVDRAGTALRIRGKLSSLLVAMIATQIP